MCVLPNGDLAAVSMLPIAEFGAMDFPNEIGIMACMNSVFCYFKYNCYNNKDPIAD